MESHTRNLLAFLDVFLDKSESGTETSTHCNQLKLAYLGAVHKRRPHSGGGVFLSSAEILRTREEGVLQMRTSAPFGVKKLGFFEIYGMSSWTRGRGLASADILRTRERGSIFRDFVRTSFMDGPL